MGDGGCQSISTERAAQQRADGDLRGAEDLIVFEIYWTELSGVAGIPLDGDLTGMSTCSGSGFLFLSPGTHCYQDDASSVVQMGDKQDQFSGHQILFWSIALAVLLDPRQTSLPGSGRQVFSHHVFTPNISFPYL
jgi:hypothetical protein